MTGRTCPHEAEVHRAAASGRWTAELRSHAVSCGACRDVMTVTALLSRDEPVVPRRSSPAILFARARHERRRRAETMASRILVGGQVVTGAVGLAVLVWLGAEVGAWRSVAAALGGGQAAALVAGGAALTAGLLASARWLSHHTS